MDSQKKILFTTSFRVQKTYDYFGANTRLNFFRFSLPRICSYGLRFIKYNIPEIDILEYPTWNEYTRKIKEGNYDVVAFSFYINDVHEIIKMIKFARENGVKEVWGGNYGILTKSMKKYFDKRFIGYAEKEIAKVLNKKLQTIRHPPLVNYISTMFGLKISAFGVLFTTRGCSMKCVFCQTPCFQSKVTELPLESIEDVLKNYRKVGIRDVVIMDENFGLMRNHSEQVINLLKKYGFYWQAFIRPDLLMRNFEQWKKKGLIGVLTGIESLRQENLDFIKKGVKIEDVINLLKKLNKNDIFTIGTYVMGFENDTIDSIKENMKKLKMFNLDLYQICVLLPLPETPLWDYIEKNYGIFEKDYHKYDAKHLVWNHPNIKPKEMEKLLDWSFKTVHPKRRMFQTTSKFAKKYFENKNLIGGMSYSMRMLIRANTFKYSV